MANQSAAFSQYASHLVCPAWIRMGKGCLCMSRHAFGECMAGTFCHHSYLGVLHSDAVTADAKTEQPCAVPVATRSCALQQMMHFRTIAATHPVRCARSAPIWFKSSTGLQRLFANGMQAVLKGFDYVNGQLNPSPAVWEANSQSILGGQPVISSNQGSNAVLWCAWTACCVVRKPPHAYFVYIGGSIGLRDTPDDLNISLQTLCFGP